jgi:predicted MFS family arabinose efflux permease
VTELFAPLRSRAFRWLEGTALFSNAGVWMITLVGGYMMERLTTSPVLVTLAAAIGPLAGICAVVFSGAAADSRDRRAVLLLAKILLIGPVAFLVLMSSSHLLTPATLLIGLAGMGVASVSLASPKGPPRCQKHGTTSRPTTTGWRDGPGSRSACQARRCRRAGRVSVRSAPMAGFSF